MGASDWWPNRGDSDAVWWPSKGGRGGDDSPWVFPSPDVWNKIFEGEGRAATRAKYHFLKSIFEGCFSVHFDRQGATNLWQYHVRSWKANIPCCIASRMCSSGSRHLKLLVAIVSLLFILWTVIGVGFCVYHGQHISQYLVSEASGVGHLLEGASVAMESVSALVYSGSSTSTPLGTLLADGDVAQKVGCSLVIAGGLEEPLVKILAKFSPTDSDINFSEPVTTSVHFSDRASAENAALEIDNHLTEPRDLWLEGCGNEVI